MQIKNKAISVLIDIIIVALIVAFGIILRLPDSMLVGSAQINDEYTDEDIFYLSDPDSYLYARKARGYSVDLSNFSFVNTRTDDYMMSPVSSKENGLVTNGLPLIAALVYRLLNLFSDISIELVVYYLNAVICSLAAIPAYLYVRKQTNFIGGIVSACLAVIAIPFLEHSVAGYFDTDAMLCTVPLCVITAFALMVGEDNRTKKIAYAIIAVIMFALLAATWETFYIYFGILGFLCVVTVFELAFAKGNDGRLRGKPLGIEVLFMAVTLIVMAIVALLMYSTTIIDSIRRLITNMLATNNYPDPTRYIVELSDIPILENGIEGAFLTTGSGMINKLGGAIVLVFALVSILVIVLVRRRVSNKFLACNIGFVVAWLLITLPLLIAGVRFLQLVCLPLALLAGLGVGIIAEIITSGDSKVIGFIASLLIAALVLFGPIAGASIRSNTPAPFYNKTFDKACTWINNYAGENADILTWWDYGYFIQFASARHVLADGGTFDGRYFYWVAKALLTDNPAMSVAIFNMLDFSGVDSMDVAEEYLPDAETATCALNEILPLSKEQGYNILMTKYSLSFNEASDIMSVAKPDVNNERYFIISRDLIAKIGALSYYGFYDFDDVTPSVSLGVSTEPAKVNMYGEKVGIRGIDDVNVVIRSDNNNEYVTLVDDNDKQIDISRIITVENGIKVRDENKGSKGYTVYCIKDSGEYSFIVCSGNIADSMLVSLMAYNSNDAYTRVETSVLGDSMSVANSDTAKFFGDSNTPENAGVYVYRVK